MALAVGFFVGLTALPIAAKWLLIGQVEGGGDPDLEPALLPLLGGQDAGAERADGGARRHPDLQPLSAAARRQDRARHRHSRRVHPGLHRPALDRRQHRSSARTRSCSATRRSRTTSTPARSRSATTPSSARRACSTSTPPWATTPSSGTRRRCRAASASPTASTITARPRRRPGRLLPDRGQALHVAAALALCRHPAGRGAWRSSRRPRS